MKPMLIGESNPYGGDDQFALYPHPKGCSGERLCNLIFGMSRARYLDSFQRRNLIRGKWSIPKARDAAAAIWEMADRPRLILCGSKVSAAFDVPYVPYVKTDDGVLVIPHPSGLNRSWTQIGAITQAREALKLFLPELALYMLGAIKERTC